MGRQGICMSGMVGILNITPRGFSIFLGLRRGVFLRLHHDFPKILRTVRPGNLKIKCRSGGSCVGSSLLLLVPYRVNSRLPLWLGIDGMFGEFFV